MRVIGLHGFSGSGRDWDPLAASLGLSIEPVDLLGHGSAPAPSTAASYRADSLIQHVLESSGRPESAVWIGYSMGGRLALRLALEHSQVVRALILIGAQPGLKDPGERAERIAQDNALAGKIEKHGVAWFCDYWSKQPMIRSQESIPSSIRDAMKERKLANRVQGLAGALRGFGQGAVTPVWTRLHEISVPTLLLTGAGDSRYASIADRMAAAIPNAIHRSVVDAGHCAHLENLDGSARLIAEFLDGLNE